MRVVIAPDSFGGTLTAQQAADAMATGWHRVHPDAEIVVVPMSDGGEGLLDALVAGDGVTGWELHTVEVADARGLATTARFLLTDDDIAVVESAQACGLAQLGPDQRDPRRTTTWGVGQLLDAAREAGARQILVGLGGSATVDGGTGALSALGFQLTVAGGSGLKVGGEDLPRIARARRTWVADWSPVEVVLLADVTEVLADAPARYGPQKGADQGTVAHLEAGLAAWREVAERDLGAPAALAGTPGSGAAGGLGYGLAVGIGARFAHGARNVARLQRLGEAVAGEGPRGRPDVVLTGEGRLDATTSSGKVVATVLEQAADAGVPVWAVVGASDVAMEGIGDLEAAAPDGPGEDPAAEVADAAERLAERWSQPRG